MVWLLATFCLLVIAQSVIWLLPRGIYAEGHGVKNGQPHIEYRLLSTEFGIYRVFIKPRNGELTRNSDDLTPASVRMNQTIRLSAATTLALLITSWLLYRRLRPSTKTNGPP